MRLARSILSGILLAFSAAAQNATETVTVDQNAAVTPFPHVWEQMFGSGRAVLSLRDSYRQDLRAVKKITGFEFMRFHAIFQDELGVYNEDDKGQPVYNFSYVDQIYDGLLQNGVRPFVELSFMPRKLAASTKPHAFWYQPLPNPPRDYQRWGALVEAFTRHVVQRYGIAEVSKWYFEVWNEPNIDFWTGEPKESTYYQLYDSAAQAVKRADSKLRVGGPSTAQAGWVDRFIAHCAEKNIPVDFASTHVYANDTAKDVFGTDENIPRSDMVARSVRKVYDQVKHSARPNLPIIWSEYNASYKNEVEVTDSPFMGPWLANNIRLCDGLTSMMSYWSFSDVFEEQGIVKTPFYGGFGLIAAGGIPKAAFNAFALLHQLGTERLASKSDSALVTRRKDGTLVIAIWNYSAPEQPSAAKQMALRVAGNSARVTTLDRDHGSALTAFRKMGSPDSPSIDQLKQLRDAGRMPASKTVSFHDSLPLTLPPYSLALVEIAR